MGREDPQLKLRLTEDLKEKVVEAARDNNRSTNSEIVARLEESFKSARQHEFNKIVRQYTDALASENEALKKSVSSLEAMLLHVAHAIRKAGDGNPAALDLLIEGEKDRALLTRIVNVSPSLEDRS